MRNLVPGDIGRYHKGPDIPILHPGESHQGGLLGRHTEIQILVQDESLEVGEDLINPTDIPSQLTTNLEDMDKDSVGAKLTRKDMENLWLTEDYL